MDYLNYVFTTFLEFKSGDCVGRQWRNRNFSGFIKKIFICVWKRTKV